MSTDEHTEEGTGVAADAAGQTSETAADSAEPTTADIAGTRRERTDEPKADDALDDEDGEGREPLFAGEDTDQFRDRWREIQSRFVDEPRRAVEEGDALVATLMQRLAETFAQERSKLESQWDRDGDVSTEDLRVALQRYRSFFDRLLSA
jgi:hypothetical protein